MEQPKDYPEIDLMSAAEKLAGAISGKTRLICRTVERCVLYVCVSVILGLFLLSDVQAHLEAKVVRVIDGDTVDVIVSPLPNVNIDLRIRVAGINAPEKRSKRLCEIQAALAAEAAVNEFLVEGKTTVSNIRLGTYAGRYVADIMNDDVSLATYLLHRCLAVSYDGRAKAPRWPCEDW